MSEQHGEAFLFPDTLAEAGWVRDSNGFYLDPETGQRRSREEAERTQARREALRSSDPNDLAGGEGGGG